MPRAAAPVSLRIEHRAAGSPALGLGVASPRLSWFVPDADPGYAQTAYEVEVTRSTGTPEIVEVASAEQVLVPWPVAPLASPERVSGRVRGRGDDEWSGRRRT